MANCPCRHALASCIGVVTVNNAHGASIVAAAIVLVDRERSAIVVGRDMVGTRRSCSAEANIAEIVNSTRGISRPRPRIRSFRRRKRVIISSLMLREL